MINKVLNFIKWFKDWLDLILKLVAIAGLLMGVFGMKGCSKHKQEKENAIDIASSQVTQHRSKSDKLITETITWDIKYNALKQHYEEKDNKNKAIISRYKQELNEAKQTIADMDIKPKNVDNYIKSVLETRSNYEAPIIFEAEPCAFKLDPIETEFLSLKFKQDANYSILGIERVSRNTIYTVVGRQAEPKHRAIFKKNIGKDHKILKDAGWLWGWDYITKTTAKDTCSVITNLVSIEFDK
jgi:hypothetical protein